jgi:hypothetical protein
MERMERIKRFLLLTVLSLPMGCGSLQTEKETPAQLRISDKVYAGQANSSVVFSSVRCVPLETGQEVLLDDIVKVAHQAPFIYVADRFSLYKFSEDGKLCGKISRNGGGPEEYIGISDFEVETEQTVWILSRSNRILYKYTWEGVLETGIQMDYWATKMYFISPEKVCLYIGNEKDENNSHQLKTIDLKTNTVISNHLEIDSKKSRYLHIHSANHFSTNLKDKNSVYFFNTFDDIIYQWQKDELKPVFMMDINHKNIPFSFYDQEYADVSVFFQYLLKGNYAYGTDLFLEYENEYLYAYFYERERHFALISKTGSEAILDFKTLNEDVVLSGYPINLTKQSYFIQKNNELILPVLPSDIIEYAAGKLNQEDIQTLQQRICYTDEDQNPVLLIVKR